MKCELKYVKHDLNKMLKEMSFSLFVVTLIIGTIAYAIALYFIQNSNTLFIISVLCLIFTFVLEYREAKQYCKNKKNN